MLNDTLMDPLVVWDGHAHTTVLTSDGETAGRVVSVVVSVGDGPSVLTATGLADSALAATRACVTAAINHSGLRFPGGRVTIDLVPAQPWRAGRAYDLAIAVALLAATGQVPARSLVGLASHGDLFPDGRIALSPATEQVVAGATRAGVSTLVVAKSDETFARRFAGAEADRQGCEAVSILGAENLGALVQHLRGGETEA